MEDIYVQFTKATFTEEYFLRTVRTAIDHMVGLFPPEIRQFYSNELMDRIMEVYKEKFPGYFDVQLNTTRQVFTEQEVATLLKIREEHPWFHEKMAAHTQLVMQSNHDNSQKMVEEIAEITEKYLEELEEEAEFMADGQH
jgi:hypothetical protein